MRVGAGSLKLLSLFASGKLQVTIELPALCVFKSANLVMHSKSLVLVCDTMKTYNNAKSKTLEKKDIPKKKEKSR